LHKYVHAFDGTGAIHRNVLGAEAALLSRRHRMHCIFRSHRDDDGGDLDAAGSLTWVGSLLVRLLWNYVSDVPWFSCTGARGAWRAGRRALRGCAARCWIALSLWLNTSLQELLRDGSGRVVGATIMREGRQITVRARCGVVLAAGGFEHNQAMREQYLPKPPVSIGARRRARNTGDALRAALAIGAATRGMEGGYWCSRSKFQTIPCRGW